MISEERDTDRGNETPAEKELNMVKRLKQLKNQKDHQMTIMTHKRKSGTRSRSVNIAKNTTNEILEELSNERGKQG